MNTTIGERLQEWIKEKGTNPNALAEATGLHQPTIHRILTGQSKHPTIKVLAPLAAYFGRPLSELLGETAPANVAPATIMGRVPVISWVQAGQWCMVEDSYMPGVAEEWVSTTEPIGPNAFALYVRGDSMEPEFSDGDIILVDPAEEAANGDFVVVRLDDEAEATFKQLIIDGPHRYLKPLNPRYPILDVTRSATICGVVMTSTKHHKRKKRRHY